MIVYALASKPLSKPKFSPIWAACLASRLLASLGHTAGWELQKEATGKPFARNRESGETAFVSISHSRKLLAVAASLTAPVGIDIEYQRQRDVQELARFAFGQREQRLVQQHGSPAFYRIWTAREAFSKATDIPLFAAMDGCDLLAPDATMTARDRDYAVWHTTALPGYTLSLVTPVSDEPSLTPREAPLELTEAALHQARRDHHAEPAAVEPILAGPLTHEGDWPGKR